MDAATKGPPAGKLSVFLAGLQAGMLGVCWMLAWLGASAAWQRRSFWTAENLMASVFYGGAAIRRGFASSTVSGLALDLALYSLLGALFAVAVGDRLPRVRVFLIGIVFALGWYYLSFHVIWKAASPLIAFLHIERPTVLGHVIYGALLGRFPAYLPRAEVPPATAAPEIEAAGAGPPASEAPLAEPAPEARTEAPEP